MGTVLRLLLVLVVGTILQGGIVRQPLPPLPDGTGATRSHPPDPYVDSIFISLSLHICDPDDCLVCTMWMSTRRTVLKDP